MSWERRLVLIHRALSVAVGIAVPVVISLVNGTFEPWMLLMGAVVGFSYWYFFPILIP